MILLDLFEARRNPELNPKTNPVDIVRARLRHSEKMNGFTNLFVSFTQIDKLGINPRSPFNTPLGIYSYPAHYVVGEVIDSPRDDLPFAGAAPYMNVFSSTGHIINLGSMTDEDVRREYQAIGKVFANEVRGAMDWKTAVDLVENIINDAAEKSKFSNLSGGRYWFVTMEVAKLLAKHRNISNIAIAWNKLFRLTGVDGCVDMGKGIIHTNEPVQAVFFHRGAITENERLINRWSNAQKRDGAREKSNHDGLMALYKEHGEDALLAYPGLIRLVRRISAPMQERLAAEQPMTLSKFKGSLAPGIEYKMVMNLVDTYGSISAYRRFLATRKHADPDALRIAAIVMPHNDNLFNAITELPQSIYAQAIDLDPAKTAPRMTEHVMLPTLLAAAERHGPKFYRNLYIYDVGGTDHDALAAWTALWAMKEPETYLVELLDGFHDASIPYLEKILGKWEPDLLAAAQKSAGYVARFRK